MKISKIAVLCLLTSVLWQGARAQWIIDGQQVQTLNLNVSDPQALYTDGSREMTAPLVFSEACSAPTSSIFQITVPWLGGVKEFFVFDASSEYLKLCDGPLNLEVGGLVLSSAGMYSMEFPGRLNFEEGVLEFGEEANISTEEGTLIGNWYVTGVAEDSSSIINRGYADSRYVMNGQDSVALGLDTAATGDYSIAAGYKNLASGKYSVAFNGGVDPEEPTEGIYTNVASGIGSAVFGWGNVASGNGAVAFGWESVASGNWSLAAGSSDAIGEFSTALGEVCRASGSDSLAAGYNTSATGTRSVALGHSTAASAQGSFANGFLSTASGNYSTAWGSYCDASGQNSIALGTRAKALHPGSVVIADSQNADVTSATNDTFTIRAQNGVYLRTDAIHSSGPLVFDSTLTATNGALQIYATDNEAHLGYFKTLDFQDGLQFCTEGSASLLFGSGNAGLLVGSATLVQLEYGKRINFETGELTGSTGAKEWHVATDPTEDSGIVNRGYADGRYLRSDTDLTAPLSFSSASTATSGLFRAYNEWNGDVENLLIYDADNELIKLGDLTTGLQIGSLKVEQYKITQPGSGRIISFEEGMLQGGWEVFNDPDSEYGIVNRGYADARYLRQGVDLTAPLAFADSCTSTGGMFRAYIPWAEQDSDLFVFDEDDECIDLSVDQNIAFRIGGVMIDTSEITGHGCTVGFEDKTFFGGWKTATVPDAGTAVINRDYADARYPLRSEGITTNRVIQAGDTLVISNGLITAINP
jgi:hypothetical protein